MSNKNKDNIAEFIEILKGETAIWQSKSDNFKNKNIKNKSWNNLLEKYKDFDPNATIDSVKKKYNCLRSSYRRELQKVNKSAKSGASTDELYVPSLWYYDNMDFLRDQEVQLEGISTFEDEFEKEPSPKKKKTEENSFLKKAADFLEETKKNKVKDEAAVYSDAWAVGFRKMSEEQKLYAKNIIDQTIMQGQLGNLNLFTSLNIKLPHFYPQRPPSSSPTPRFINSPLSVYSHSSHSPYQHQMHSPNQHQMHSPVSFNNIPTPSSTTLSSTDQQTTDVNAEHHSFQELFNDSQFAHE